MGSHARPRPGITPAPAEQSRGRHRAAAARGHRQFPLPAVAGAAVLAVAASAGVAVAAEGLSDSGGASLAAIAVAPSIASAPAPERATRTEVRAAIDPRAAKKARALAKQLRDGRLAAAAAARLAALQRSCGYDQAAQRDVELSAAQLANARTIVAVSQRMGLPARAAVIAIATALQESQLTNMSGGHLDSAGLFQQRPSAGWGSHAEVTNIEYSARTFYRVLSGVDGWRRLPLTVVAQDVQVSAFPWAYARWEGAAARLVSSVLRVPVNSLNCAPR